MSRMGSSRLWGKITVLIAVCGWALSAQAKYSGGSGTQAEPFRISAVSDWQELMVTPADWGGHFILTSDIDLNGVSITPIAPDTSTDYDFQGTQFTGVFDGNDHIVRNVDINMPGGDYVGLFGYVGTGGQIKNLGVENASIFGNKYVGGLVGFPYNDAITDCYSTGSVRGNSDVGGLVGVNYYGTISACYSAGSVSGVGDYAGGLVGRNYFGPITNSYSTGSVSGQDGVGGLVGENDSSGIITKCYSTGSVSGNYVVGGLVGWNKSTVTASFWDTQTSGQPGSAGGTPKTTAEMKTMSTFTDVGWDFVNVWHLCEGTNYPRLLWQIPAGDFLCPYGVDVLDLAFFVERWLDADCNESNNFCNCTDINHDAQVDFGDFAFFSRHWLEGVIPQDMVLIPGGTFEMGDSFAEGASDERPVHTVTLDSFYMGKYEITNQQYCDYLNGAMFDSLIEFRSGVVYPVDRTEPYLDTHSADSDSQIDYCGDTFTPVIRDGHSMADHPVLKVSWYGAAAYCNWLSRQEGKELCYGLSTWSCDFARNGYRLPTEAEWEYAARGGCHDPYYKYPWCGDTIDCSKANCELGSESCNPLGLGSPPYTSIVGLYTANNFGLFDMAGNAWEWCNDWSDWPESDYYQNSPAENPTGPASGAARVIRGGGWLYGTGDDCRAARRGRHPPSNRRNFIGFRPVLDF